MRSAEFHQHGDFQVPSVQVRTADILCERGCPKIETLTITPVMHVSVPSPDGHMSITIWKSASRAAAVASSPRESYAFVKVRGSLALCLLLIAGNAVAGSILFIGNSFTYAQGSPLRVYRSGTVTDLNHQGIGGVPSLFKSFTVQAGL